MNDETSLADRFTPKQLKTFVADPQVLTLRYSPDAKFLIAAGYDARIRRWKADDDELPELAAIEGHHGWTQAIGFSPDASRVYSGDSWGELRACPLADENPQPVWKVDAAHDGWIRDLAVSPDGQTLATVGRDRLIKLWSAADGKKKSEITGEHDDPYCIAYTADGKHLLAGDRKGIVWQWSAADGKLERKFDAGELYKYDRIQDVGGVRTLAFDKAGQWLAVGGMRPKNGATVQGVPLVLLFDWASGELKHTLELGATNDCDVMGVHLHDDGFMLVITNGGPGTGKILLHKLGDEKPFFTESKIANVQSLAWHPGGKRFAVSGTNNGSNGNGRRLKDGEYLGNVSPIHVFSLGDEAKAEEPAEAKS